MYIEIFAKYRVLGKGVKEGGGALAPRAPPPLNPPLCSIY